MVIGSIMAVSAKTRRRCLGAVLLAGALVLLLCGQTVLAPHLTGAVFVGYWLVCLLLALLALLVALADLRAIGLQARQEQQALLQDAFGKAGGEAGPKPANSRFNAGK